MGDHVSSQMSNWQCLLLVIAFAALGNGLEVGSQGFVDAIETLGLVSHHQKLPIAWLLTFVPDIHLCLHRFEVIRQIGPDFIAHSLPRPLPEAIELSVHCGGCGCMDESS